MTQQGVVPMVAAASSRRSLGSGTGQSDGAAPASAPVLGPWLPGKGGGGGGSLVPPWGRSPRACAGSWTLSSTRGRAWKPRRPAGRSLAPSCWLRRPPSREKGKGKGTSRENSPLVRREGRQLLRQYLGKGSYKDAIVDLQSRRVQSLLGHSLELRGATEPREGGRRATPAPGGVGGGSAEASFCW